MKLLVSNGKTLDVRDVGPCLIQVRARSGGPPIKLHGFHLMSDDEARDKLREVMGSGHYDWERFDEQKPNPIFDDPRYQKVKELVTKYGPAPEGAIIPRRIFLEAGFTNEEINKHHSLGKSLR